MRLVALLNSAENKVQTSLETAWVRARKRKGDALMQWKKWLAPLLAAVVLVALVVTGVLIFNIKQRVPTVAICVRDLQSTHEYAEQIEYALVARGYQVRIVDAKGDHNTQLQQITQLLDDGVDGLVVSPVMTSASDALVKKAQTANVPIVFFERQPEEAAMALWDRISYVGSDAVQAGALQAEVALAQTNNADINGDGIVSYVIVENDPERRDTQQYFSGIQTGFESAELATKMISKTDCDGNRTGGRKAFEKELADFGKDIEVVLCNNDQIALGALDAIIDGGRTVGKDIYLIGIGGTQEAADAVTAGTMTATMYQDRNEQAQKISLVIDNLINNEPIEKQYTIDYKALKWAQ